MRENPTPDVIPLMVQPFFCCDLQIRLPYNLTCIQPIELFEAIPWDALGGPEKDQVLCVCGEAFQVCSPRILLASWMSLGKKVTYLAWIAQRLVSSNSTTRYALAASWSANSAEDWDHISCATSIAISLTNLWNGTFLMRDPINF